MADVPTAKSRAWNKAWLLVCRCTNYLIFHGYFILFCALTTIVTTGLIPVFLLNIFSVENIQLAMTTLKPLTRIFGISWKIRDAAILKKERLGVIVANHQSSLDFVGMTNIWHEIGNCVPTAKKELLYAGPFGLSGWLAGVCFLDRRNPQAAWKALSQGNQRSCANGSKLWIFAEGTRNCQGQTLLPFKKGAFRMAIASQVPVLPVVYSPYYFVDKKNYKLYRGGKMVLQVLAPIPTRGLTMDDLDDLRARTMQVMQKAYDALSEEVQLTLNASTS